MLSNEAEIRGGRTHNSHGIKADYGIDEQTRDSDE